MERDINAGVMEMTYACVHKFKPIPGDMAACEKCGKVICQSVQMATKNTDTPTNDKDVEENTE